MTYSVSWDIKKYVLRTARSVFAFWFCGFLKNVLSFIARRNTVLATSQLVDPYSTRDRKFNLDKWMVISG